MNNSELNQEQSSHHKITVLVVEDVEINYKYLNILFRIAGIDTVWAKNGMEAIRLSTENEDIDIVLMDINMPKMNGYQATIEIKKNKPNLPIIAQTANAISGDEKKALDAGCDDYVSKPIDKTRLFEIIERLLN